jgi:drug/metabolite transporter (DMT)-like permease
MAALGAGFAWAFYIVTNKKVITSPKIEVTTLVACVMLTTSVIMIPFTIIFGGLDPGKISIGYSGLGFILYIGIFCNVIPYILWTSGLRKLQPTVSSLMLLFEVFIAAILAMLFLNEFLTLIGLMGGLFIVFAIIIISLDAKKSNNNK